MQDWTKNIPENGILCFDEKHYNYFVIFSCDGIRCFDKIGNFVHEKLRLRPLSRKEWLALMPEQETKQELEIIWLQKDDDDNLTWCEDKINDDDIKYIRAGE